MQSLSRRRALPFILHAAAPGSTLTRSAFSGIARRLLSTKKHTSSNVAQRKPRDAPREIDVDLPKTQRYGSILSLTIFFSLGLFTVGHIFFHYFYSGDLAYGISMLPTISAFGQWLIISKKYRRGRNVVVGDVVSFKHPVKEGEYAVKRVIGMEGDFVLMDTPGKNERMLQVPQGHCWVVGDDLPHSRDSRMFGPLPMALISGKVIAKVDLSLWSMFSPISWFSSWSWVENGLKDAPADADHDD